MERLSSGLRVNSSADDAAGLAVAGKMENQLRGINMAVRNAQDGIGLLKTAEAGINEIRNMVLRMRELAVQMANGIYESADRTNAQLEVAQLITQVSLIADNTKFNNVALLAGGISATAIQAGPTTSETIALTIRDMSADGTPLAISAVTVATTAGATAAMTTLDTALGEIAKELATLGAYQNQLTYSANYLSKASVSTEGALGRIMDADFATETTNLAKQQILNQAAVSMLAQANQSKQSVLALLQ